LFVYGQKRTECESQLFNKLYNFQHAMSQCFFYLLNRKGKEDCNRLLTANTGVRNGHIITMVLFYFNENACLQLANRSSLLLLRRDVTSRVKTVCL
jgi:hypothetical protein